MQKEIDYPSINVNTPPFSKSSKNMGVTLEKVIRRNRMSISELSRNLDVSRRTIYNWFESETLSFEILNKIGFVIGHDFSGEFPEEFANRNNAIKDHIRDAVATADTPANPVYYWMDRYIKLLEKYTEVLNHEIKDHEKHDGKTGLILLFFIQASMLFDVVL